MNWMKQRGAAHETFFCYLPLNAAHAPCIVPEKYSEPFAKTKAPGFFGMIANIDENMGRLESFLRDSGLRDNTIVIFMTDNGGTAGVPVFNAGLRGHKTEYYDGGHRVPCFVRWPGGGLTPRDVSVPAQVQDIMPTLLDFCGVTDDGTKRDGASLSTLLSGTVVPAGKPFFPADRMFVVQYGASPEVPTDPEKWHSCVVWNQWRLVHGTELYDIVADRAQQHDLAASLPKVVEQMRAHYVKWWSGIEPKLHDFVPFSIGAAQENPVQLTSSDWQDTYADNANHIRNAAGGPQGGPWNVNIEQAGKYEITLRRWPFDSDAALDGNVTPPGKALPIAAAKLTVAGLSQQQKTAPGDHEAVFHLDLPAGRTQLHAWFQDASGSDLCGAYFVKVLRL